jgi:hypothetical protein
MWRQITGVVLLVSGIVVLAAELFFIIALDKYLLSSPTFAIFRMVIAIALIGSGIKLMRPPEPNDFDEWE